jgi:hypothetical protein
MNQLKGHPVADSTDKKHKDSPEEMHSAHAWLEHVAEELDLPQDVVRASIRDILDLTSAVAHNRSRPAAPVTAFLVGLAAGQAAGQAAEQSAEQGTGQGSENTSTDNLSASFTPLIERITNLAQD